MFSFIQLHPIIIAPFVGIIPALFWLWFWLKEDPHAEPHRKLTLCFLGGMLAVIIVLPIQKIIYISSDIPPTWVFVVWAGLEELMKFAFAFMIALGSNDDDEPVDNIIYMIVVALGFVALENTLFLVNPITSGSVVDTVITVNLRFVGASLLHIMTSSIIGASLGLAFYKTKKIKMLYLASGVILAVTLHTLFNLFIINQPDNGVFLVFGSVWLGIILIMLLFEKIKNIQPAKY